MENYRRELYSKNGYSASVPVAKIRLKPRNINHIFVLLSMLYI